MARLRRKCPRCENWTGVTGPFCPNCGAELTPDISTEPNAAVVEKTNEPEPGPEPENEIQAQEANTEDKKPTMENEEKKNTPNSTRWLINIALVLLIVAMVVVIIFGVYACNNRHNPKTTTPTTTVPTTAAPTSAVINPTTAAPTPAPTAAPTPAGDYITVYRGDTDQETIDFNDGKPALNPDDTIVWTDNSFHMAGGVWTIQKDGIISGDIKVNGVTFYDNDEKTFLVVEVKKGDIVEVNPDWMAWFTNHYDKQLVVSAVQTQFPTWTRQSSELN